LTPDVDFLQDSAVMSSHSSSDRTWGR